ncbi:tyrosine-type recombinase/integrase [Lederbergia lenta]|uniref:tyrosine-type recombinase/integrase n=1 Tax=Lederbergia lenta TaxID=1467 RepID=UPI00203B51BF|nr:site-specific integrase [Lederbergia lenta]MCM3110635.1 site-specific integrase [Lederbergia lenta]
MAYFQKVPAKNKQGYRWKCTEDAPPHPITGKRRQVTRRADTKKEAQNKVDVAIEELVSKDDNSIESGLINITVTALFERWFELVMKRKVKETTFKEYNNAVNFRIIPILGDYKVTQLNTMLLQKFINDLTDEALAPRYIEYISTILYGALESARKWKIIQFNPLADVERPRPRRTENKTWSVEEMDLFLNITKVTDLRLFTIVSVALKTGVRRGEVLALKWSDVDFEKQEISIDRSLVYDDEGYRFSTPKTESSIRRISIGKSLIDDLKKWRVRQNEFKMAFRKVFKDEDLIFTTEIGKPVYPRTLTQKFHEAIRVSGVPKIRFHDLRHTHATLCLEAGMSIKEVQDRLGHASIKTTGDVYAHVTDKMKVKSTDLFEKHISK